MTINESQRRTLDLMAESIGWLWADVEVLARDLCGENVAGLTHRQGEMLLAELEWVGQEHERKPQRRVIEVEPGVVCDPCSRCGEQCPPSPNDALCWKCAKEVRNAAVA